MDISRPFTVGAVFAALFSRSVTIVPPKSRRHSTRRSHWSGLRSLAVVLVLGLATHGFAAPIAGWNVGTQPGGSNNFGTSPLAPTFADLNVTVGGLTRGSGVGTTGTGAARAWGGNTWNSASAAAAVTANQFATFTITPNAGFTFSLSAISKFDYRRSGTGAASAVVQYRVGAGAFTDIATISYPANTSAGGSVAPIDLMGIAALQNVAAGTAITFRIVNYGGTSTGGTWYIFDVANSTATDLQVDGTVTTSGGDMTPPNVISFNPLDGATSVPITAAPSITFNEAVQKGTGSILIKRSSDDTTFESIPVSSGQVVASGTTATITPGTTFANSTGYYIEIPAGAIEDIAGNDYVGLSGAAAWKFTTLAATASPEATKTFATQTRVTQSGSSTTADYYGEGSGQGNFAVYGFGTFNFSKIDFNLSGASTVTGITQATFKLRQNNRSFTTGTQLEFFLTTDASTGKTFNPAFANGIAATQYSFAPISLGQFTYTPTAIDPTYETFTLNLNASAMAALVSRLNTGEDFSIILAAVNAPDAITFAGKGNTFDPFDPELKLTVSETTGTDSTPPTVAFFTPADGAGGLPISSNIRVAFNELVRKGAGTITIFRADNSVFEAIDVAGTNVTVNLGTLTIDPAAALESATGYYVQITPGAIEDVSGNDFAGIADTTTWNFSTAQPPITNLGPFSISQNAPAGTVVGVLNANIGGKEGIKYALLGGSGGSTLMKAEPGTGYLVSPVWTMGDTLEGATGALNTSSAGSFSPVGTPDGLGAFSLNASTVRVFMNHEIEVPTTGTAGYPFTLSNGTVLNKGGARISYIDIDKTSRRVVDAGLAIARIYDRSGAEVMNPAQLELGGLDRMCSASLYEPNLFGPGRGLVDRIYLTGEETSTAFDHPHGGTFWALDTSNGDFWALPDMGRGSWENAALVDTGTTTHVAFLLGDDLSGTTQNPPLYLYVGEKSTSPTANFIQRNGLSGGQLYVWKANNGDLTPQQFNVSTPTSSDTRAGTWEAIDARAAAVSAGTDADRYKKDTTLRNEADALGAFSFSRPEDLSTSPVDGTLVAFASTGKGLVYPLDSWGDVYVVDLDFTNLSAPTASIRILYDADTAGRGQFMSPQDGLRNPDNLDWSDDGFIYVQEDQSTPDFGAAGEETSIWRLDPVTGAAVRVAQTDRSTVLPLGSSDGNVGDFGNWESSGIIDVSTLFGEAAGTLFLFDVQAHSIRNGLISSKQLYEGGQLCFLERGLEKGAFALNPNTGVITLANPAALDFANAPAQTLRLQAFDGTNHTLRTVTINVTNAPASTSNNLEVATYNVSLFRATSGALISDLASVTNTQAANLARVIQRNNPDVLLVNEFDYDAGGVAARRFQENYLEVGQNGEAPVYYPYAFVAPANTGVHSGFDLDENGTAVSNPAQAGYGEDAFGFGTHPGQYAFVVLSKFPIDSANIRTFQKFLWKDMPGALLPDNPNIAGTGDWYSPAELNVFRLSSKNHADVPVLVNGTRVHILASHPTPPVFDDPASGAPWIAGVDHNGRRNSDEIRFWSDYVNPAASSYIYDDTETPATASGGLPVNSRFVLVGDQNADQNEGDSTDPAIKQITGGGSYAANVLFNTTFVPAGGSGPQPDDTADFSSGVRVDYALPSAFGLAVNGGGVFWPPAGDPLAGAATASDHHLVFVNLSLLGVELPPSTDLISYYGSAQGLSGATLQATLQNIIDDHVVIDYGTIDEVMQVIDEAAPGSNQVRLLYSNATLPKTSNNIPGGWNREHVWPRSDGVGDEGADYSDLHHLFPCKDSVNSLRSNLPFDESANLDRDPFAPESFKDSDSWEPLDRDKGVVARALLYMMTRYDGSDALTTDLLLANNPSPVGTHGVLSTLLTWHRAFPPTDYERARNNAIYTGVNLSGTSYAQGNRNPFIDFPQFADAIFLNTGTASFAKWQLQKFTLAQLLSAALSGASGDADGDGRSNYSEFLLNGNPVAGNDSPFSVTLDGNQITIVFDRPKGSVVLESAAIQTSPTLAAGSWATVANWEASATFTDLGDYDRVTYVTTIDPVATPRLFWRVIFQ